MAKATMTYLNKEDLETDDANRAGEVSGKLKAMLGKESSKLGHMPEHAGGGQPISKGKTWSQESSKKRAAQPYDPETGKFTNNSMNFKELSYHPQRSSGKSMNEIFGGVKSVFEKGSVIATEDAERMILAADFTRDDLVRAMAEYKKGEGYKYDDYVPGVTKKGRTSKKERETIDNGGGIVGKIDINNLSENTRAVIDEAAEKFSQEKANWIFGRNSIKNRPTPPTPPTPPSGPDDPNTPPPPPSGPSNPSGPDTPPPSDDDEDDDKEFDLESIKKDPQAYANTSDFRKMYNRCVPEKFRGSLSAPRVLALISSGRVKTPNKLKLLIKEKFGD